MASVKPTNQNNLAKVGMNLLKRLVYDESTLEADNRRNEDRTSVVGEVLIQAFDPQGNALGQAKVFIRDLSKNGCGLWSRIHFPAGTVLKINFPAVNGQPPMMRAAYVRHCRGAAASGFAVGCRFDAELPM